MSTATVNVDPLTVSASELQDQLAGKQVTSRQLVKLFLDQIAKYDGTFKAIIATAPRDLLDETASKLDAERDQGRVRGPLHGIPIVLKDNIAVLPELGLPTTCGSLALVGSKPRRNAAIVDQLIKAGAILLGKANLSEWAWYRSNLADSGWSAVGGQTLSAYVREGFRKDDTNGGHSNPGGPSSGSAVAVAAGFCPFSVGTETMGSLVMPSDRSALYTIKPTLKLVSQDGIIPVAEDADSAGPMTKTVLDLANLLDVLVDLSKSTAPAGGYKSAVTGKWKNIRIGVVEPDKWLFPNQIVKYEEAASNQMKRDWKSAYEKLETLAEVVKPVTVLSQDEATEGGKKDIWKGFDARFKKVLEQYLASIDDCKVRSLEDVIEFNKQHAEEELPPSADNQAGFLRALEAKMSDEEYQDLVDHARHRCGKAGIDKVMEEHGINIIVGPGDGPLFMIAGTAGYPSATLPLGHLDFNGRPFGLQMMARANEDALLIQAQSAWEASLGPRRPPPLDEVVASIKG